MSRQYNRNINKSSVLLKPYHRLTDGNCYLNDSYDRDREIDIFRIAGRLFLSLSLLHLKIISGRVLYLVKDRSDDELRKLFNKLLYL